MELSLPAIIYQLENDLYKNYENKLFFHLLKIIKTTFPWHRNKFNIENI